MIDMTVAGGLALGASMVLSATYEAWRVVARANVSVHDEPRRFVREQVPFYALSFIVVWGLLNDQSWALFVALALTGFTIVYAIVGYVPKALPARNPGLPDYVECVLFLVGIGAAAVLLVLDLAGITLVGGG